MTKLTNKLAMASPLIPCAPLFYFGPSIPFHNIVQILRQMSFWQTFHSHLRIGKMRRGGNNGGFGTCAQ